MLLLQRFILPPLRRRGDGAKTLDVAGTSLQMQ